LTQHGGWCTCQLQCPTALQGGTSPHAPPLSAADPPPPLPPLPASTSLRAQQASIVALRSFIDENKRDYVAAAGRFTAEQKDRIEEEVLQVGQRTAGWTVGSGCSWRGTGGGCGAADARPGTPRSCPCLGALLPCTRAALLPRAPDTPQVVSSCRARVEQLTNSIVAAQQQRAPSGRPVVNEQTVAHLHGAVSGTRAGTAAGCLGPLREPDGRF
jgi:hypothetical protein